MYTKSDCSLCEAMKQVVFEVRREIPFEFREIDITEDPHLGETYKEQVPVLFIDGRMAFKYRVDPIALKRRLRESR